MVIQTIYKHSIINTHIQAWFKASPIVGRKGLIKASPIVFAIDKYNLSMDWSYILLCPFNGTALSCRLIFTTVFDCCKYKVVMYIVVL
jgi:hypothetical protein